MAVASYNGENCDNGAITLSLLFLFFLFPLSLMFHVILFSLILHVVMKKIRYLIYLGNCFQNICSERVQGTDFASKEDCCWMWQCTLKLYLYIIGFWSLDTIKVQIQDPHDTIGFWSLLWKVLYVKRPFSDFKKRFLLKNKDSNSTL